MVITKKIERDGKDLESEREKIILKGGKVSADSEGKSKKRKPILIRVPEDWLEKIDKLVEGKCGMNRTTWILQAAEKELRRENGLE